MTQPSMPQMPGAGAMSDTLEFMKNLWGNVKMPGVSIPGMVMPTLSVEEIDKQITDLKAVESWLTVNMNMLHGTIKALEVQSATLSTLQSMSANFSAAMQPPAAQAATKSSGEAASFHSPFSMPTPKPESKAEPKIEARPEPKSAPHNAADSAATEQLPNPAAWWNLLQDQFKQAVAGAIPAAPKVAAKSEQKAKPKAKSVTKAKVATAPGSAAKNPAAPARRATTRKA